MRNIKIFIASVALVVCFCTTAKAIVPLAIPAWYYGASVALHVAAAAAGLYYAMTPSGSRNVNASGTLSRDAKVTWIDTNDIVQEKNVKATMTNDKMVELAHKNNGATYPGMNDAVHKIPGSNGPWQGMAEGDKFKYNGNWQQVTAKNVSPGSNACRSNTDPNPQYLPPNQFMYMVGGGNASCSSNAFSIGSFETYTYTNSTPPPPVPATPVQIAENMAGSPLGGTVSNTGLQTEIDKMMQDPDYVPMFSDATTGLPFVPPPSSQIQTPTQVAAHNAEAQAASSAQGTVDSYNNAATAAGNAYQSAKAASDAAPGDSVLAGKTTDAYNLWQGALAAAAAAAASRDKLASEQAAKDAAKEEEQAAAPPVPGDNTYNTDIVAPDKKNISDLIHNFLSSSPLISMIQGFTIQTSDAVGVVHLLDFHGTSVDVDLTKWVSYMQACGTMLLVVVHGFAIFIVIKGW